MTGSVCSAQTPAAALSSNVTIKGIRGKTDSKVEHVSIEHRATPLFARHTALPSVLHCSVKAAYRRENPFRHRICEVFSRDGKGNLSFEDFLDMLSVFSEQAPRDIKVFYAFKIYDFDEDELLGPSDLEQTLRLLTRNELTPEEVTQACEKVVEESDVDGDGKLSFMEFEHVITRAPDFLSTFHIRI
uniref:EF-hand domain-containing protein n=2 Tax=Timema TaxID=61471 RepID=A0A7R9CAL8_TIMCR|nr:unnamed protein product [Timema cristinae]